MPGDGSATSLSMETLRLAPSPSAPAAICPVAFGTQIRVIGEGAGAHSETVNWVSGSVDGTGRAGQP